MNLKRSFVRALWGIDNTTNNVLGRRNKVLRDIEVLKYNKYANDFITYVFGVDNYNFLVEKGFKCKLVSDQPILYCTGIDYEISNGCHYYTHKLHVLKEAMKDFDQIVFLDWDCMEVKKTPDYFWDVLSKKHPLQAILRVYSKIKCPWRNREKRFRPCASFIYVADKEIPDKLLKIWESNKNLSEEQIIALYTDEITNGWQNLEVYWDNFEPPFFKFQNVYPNKPQDICFLHFSKRVTKPYFKKINLCKNEEDKYKYMTKILDGIYNKHSKKCIIKA